MKTVQYTITDPIGIHARPAGMLAKEAAKYKSTITIEIDGKQAQANRLMAIMGLGIKSGQEITVKVEGSDETEAAEAIENFLKENL